MTDCIVVKLVYSTMVVVTGLLPFYNLLTKGVKQMKLIIETNYCIVNINNLPNDDTPSNDIYKVLAITVENWEVGDYLGVIDYKGGMYIAHKDDVIFNPDIEKIETMISLGELSLIFPVGTTFLTYLVSASQIKPIYDQLFDSKYLVMDTSTETEVKLLDKLTVLIQQYPDHLKIFSTDADGICVGFTYERFGLFHITQETDDSLKLSFTSCGIEVVYTIYYKDCEKNGGYKITPPDNPRTNYQSFHRFSKFVSLIRNILNSNKHLETNELEWIHDGGFDFTPIKEWITDISSIELIREQIKNTNMTDNEMIRELQSLQVSLWRLRKVINSRSEDIRGIEERLSFDISKLL